MSKKLFSIPVNKSFLSEGFAVPIDSKELLISEMDAQLPRGGKKKIEVTVNGKIFEVDIRNINLKNNTREMLQIRYPKDGEFAGYLKTVFEKSLDHLKETPAYVDVYAIDASHMEWICYPETIKQQFVFYVGGENDFSTYRRSYKLVFYKFLLGSNDYKISVDEMTEKFRQFYVDRAHNNEITDINPDPAIVDPINTTDSRIRNLIMQNPYDVIHKKGFVELKKVDGKDYFELNETLKEELLSEDVEQIRRVVDKKIRNYYKSISEGIELISLKNSLERFVNEAESERKNSFSNNPYGAFVRQDLPKAIMATDLLDPDLYNVKGAVGAGVWADVFWLGIFDKTITEGAQKGVYIVYLLSKDSNTLYLTLNQGCTDIKNEHSMSETIQILRDRAKEISESLNPRDFIANEVINLGDNLTQLAKLYQYGTIMYKAYTKGKFPSEKVLYDDLKNLVDIYKEYVSMDVVERRKEVAKVDMNRSYSNVKHNRIFFGAPGTGKSFSLNKEKDNLLANGGTFERVTFHPDYSYANFVGTYKPVPMNDGISYKFVQGPFMRVLVEALADKTLAPHLLLIEEINRANVAAVFGDVFQLLDRKNGASEYPINPSEDVKKYLFDELGYEIDELRIPDNMFIWATMNSADQGVFPMDTAFKRRWDFEYIGIDDGEDAISGKMVDLANGTIEWNKLRKAINNYMISININEDKLLGPYFIYSGIFDDEKVANDRFVEVFKNKVLMYLFEDAVRQKRKELFAGCSEENKNIYSGICKEFDEKGIEIFNQDIINEVNIK